MAATQATQALRQRSARQQSSRQERGDHCNARRSRQQLSQVPVVLDQQPLHIGSWRSTQAATYQVVVCGAPLWPALACAPQQGSLALSARLNRPWHTAQRAMVVCSSRRQPSSLYLYSRCTSGQCLGDPERAGQEKPSYYEPLQ